MYYKLARSESSSTSEAPSLHNQRSYETSSKSQAPSLQNERSHETSSKSQARSLRNERFVRDFLQKSSAKSPKRAFRTRLPPKVKRQVSKTSVSYETSATNPKRNLTCVSRPRRARSPQRVARDQSKTQSHLHFAPSMRTISAEGCPRPGQNAISPAFRALDTHDLGRAIKKKTNLYIHIYIYCIKKKISTSYQKENYLVSKTKFPFTKSCACHCEPPWQRCAM